MVSIVAGIGVAVLLNEAFWGRAVLRGLVIFPYIVPAIVVVFIWKFMFNSRGVVNDLLRELGVVATFIPWLGDQRFAMAAVIVISAWAWFPFAAITLLAALQNIPDTIFEAAVIDGAGPSVTSTVAKALTGSLTESLTRSSISCLPLRNRKSSASTKDLAASG